MSLVSLCAFCARNIDFLLSIAMLGNTYVLVNLFNCIWRMQSLADLDKIMVHLCTEIQIGDRAASSFVVVTTPSIHFGLHKMCSATSDLQSLFTAWLIVTSGLLSISSESFLGASHTRISWSLEALYSSCTNCQPFYTGLQRYHILFILASFPGRLSTEVTLP